MLKILLDLLLPAERISAFFLTTWVLVVALVDVIGIASIMPFIAVLSNPGLVQNNEYLAGLYEFSGYQSSYDFLFLLGTIVFLLLLISLSLKALTVYVQTRFTLRLEYSLGRRLLSGYLNQPYEWFLNQNSSELGKSILTEVSNVISNAFAPMMAVITQTIIAITILILLLLVDPFLALVVFITLTASYFLIFKTLKKLLKGLGQTRFDANHQKFSVINELFGGIKDVKLGGLEDFYLEKFARPALIYSKSNAVFHVLYALPRFALEAVAFGGMLLMILYMMAMSDDFEAVLPKIALYAIAGYRLMPALQQIYEGFSKQKFSTPAVKKLHDDLTKLKRTTKYSEGNPVSFSKSIELKNVVFKYPKSKKRTIDNINLIIPAYKTIGFVGPTGSGKSTIVDTILGLLSPHEGEVRVDNKALDVSNYREWQKNIGYIPQHIYLSDGTIEANIAFNEQKNRTDKAAVISAAKIASLHEFVSKDLPEGYDTLVGERGVRLSGGQRQRIGIARALYHIPKLLVLDEATSALDNITEQAVMDAVANINHEITIVIIAHRLSTLKKCDKIYFIENGKIKSEGTYAELLKLDNVFRSMALGQVEETSDKKKLE